MGRFLLYLWCFMTLLLVSCHDENDEEDIPEPEIPEETLQTNKWIHDQMSEVYFWAAEMPAIDETKENDPKAYFYKLLYEDDDFSWITNNYDSLQATYNGDPVAMGYDPAFYIFGDDPDRVFIVVNYVFPESGAYAAGLRRGNIILRINDQELTTRNYYELYSGSAYSVELGKLTVSGDNWQISESGKTLDLTSAISNTDPAVHYEVIDTLGYRIGYLAYTEFLTGKDSIFFDSMDRIFGEFKSAGISDLIVDLRYNPGGDIDAAVRLASEIAPAAVASGREILVNLEYNEEYRKTVERYYPDELNYKFVYPPGNLNLQRVYFLTTFATASASELAITGLDPYMDVVQIGDSTYGKFYGAYVIPDEDEKWAILPIVMKYSNADGYTDFTDGLIPDPSNLIDDDLVVNVPWLNDQLIYSYPLGDPSDPLTKRAVELIAGRTGAVSTRSSSLLSAKFAPFHAERKYRKDNLLVPFPK